MSPLIQKFNNSKSGSNIKETKNQYSIEKIIKKRTRNNKIEYYLKWKGFNDKYNNWVAAEDINCLELIEKFSIIHNKKGKKSNCKSKVIVTKTSTDTVLSQNHKFPLKQNSNKMDKVDKHNVNSDAISEDNECVDTDPITDSKKVPKKVIPIQSDGQLMFILSYEGLDEADVITRTEAEKKYPQLVIKLYEDNLIYCRPKNV